MPTIALQIALIVALIVVNGVFAMAEMAVVSSRRARLRTRVEAGERGAAAALKLVDAPDQFLSTVQVGITLVGILAGAFGGAALAEPLSNAIEAVPALDPYSEELGLAIVVLSITFLSLIVGELVPKRIALNSPERIASRVAGPMRVLSAAASPLVWLLTRSTDVGFRLLGLRETGETRVTEEEIRHLLSEGAQHGIFDVKEQAMVERVFRFADQRVGAVMTPRVGIEFVDLDEPLDKTLEALHGARHSRLVACRGDLDNTVGIINVRDALPIALDGKPVDPQQLLRTAHYVPEHAPALTLLDHFKRTGERVALVIDEYGGLAGLASIEDVIESLVGYMPWAAGTGDEPDIVQRGDGSYLVDGNVLPDELERRIGAALRPSAAEAGYRTVAGWVVTKLGRIPDVGEHFESDGLRVEVVDMDGPRVDRLLISRSTETE